jgi:hypothetical protein
MMLSLSCRKITLIHIHVCLYLELNNKIIQLSLLNIVESDVKHHQTSNKHSIAEKEDNILFLYHVLIFLSIQIALTE